LTSKCPVPQFPIFLNTIEIILNLGILDLTVIIYPVRKPPLLALGMVVVPFSANTAFDAPCEPSRWKGEDFLTGFAHYSTFPLLQSCPKKEGDLWKDIFVQGATGLIQFSPRSGDANVAPFLISNLNQNFS
jgi:hypothetical protein